MFPFAEGTTVFLAQSFKAAFVDLSFDSQMKQGEPSIFSLLAVEIIYRAFGSCSYRGLKWKGRGPKFCTGWAKREIGLWSEAAEGMIKKHISIPSSMSPLCIKNLSRWVSICLGSTHLFVQVYLPVFGLMPHYSLVWYSPLDLWMDLGLCFLHIFLLDAEPYWNLLPGCYYLQRYFLLHPARNSNILTFLSNVLERMYYVLIILTYLLVL